MMHLFGLTFLLYFRKLSVANSIFFSQSSEYFQQKNTVIVFLLFYLYLDVLHKFRPGINYKRCMQEYFGINKLKNHLALIQNSRCRQLQRFGRSRLPWSQNILKINSINTNQSAEKQCLLPIYICVNAF